MKRILFTGESIKKLNTEIGPRFNEAGLKGGFTKIEKLGKRHPDRAMMA